MANLQKSSGAFGRVADLLRKDDISANLGTLALGLGAVGLAEPIIDDVGDVVRDRYKDMNSPVWKAMGNTQLYSDYSNLADYQKRYEALLKLKYDKPVDIAGSVGEDLVGTLGKGIKDTANEYKTRRAFDVIQNSPQVRALGQEKARQIFDQVAALSPNVIRNAPNVALSIMNDAIMTDSTALRPELANQLTRASSELSKQ